MKLNRNRKFGSIHPAKNGAFFLQDGHYFDNAGDEVDIKTGERVPEVAVRTTVAPELNDKERAEAEAKAKAEAEALQKASDEEKAALAELENAAGVAHVVDGDEDGDGVPDALKEGEPMPVVTDEKPAKGKRK